MSAIDVAVCSRDKLKAARACWRMGDTVPNLRRSCDGHRQSVCKQYDMKGMTGSKPVC